MSAGAPAERFSTAVTNNDAKFDIQLGNARKAEDRLAYRLQRSTIELKTESYLWPRTGNLFIEASAIKRTGVEPTGIGVTEADFWAHELVTENGETIAYIVIPTYLLREMVSKFGRRVDNAGDGKRQSGWLLSLDAISRAFRHYGRSGI